MVFHAQRRYYREFLIKQFLGKRMFFHNGRIAPSSRPIEFGDNKVVILKADLIDPIFVAVQSQEAAAGRQPSVLDGVKDLIRREAFVGNVGIGTYAHNRDHSSKHASLARHIC